jgi:hypothetical protein
MAAEAVSYVTIRGVAGEPLKVVLLADDVDPREATAAVALERLAYTIGTTVIVGIGSVVALIVLPLSRIWSRIFIAFAIVGGLVTLATAIVLTGHGSYLGALGRSSLSSWRARAGRFVAEVEIQLLAMARHHPARLVVLSATTIVCYLFMALEAFAILRAMQIPVTFAGALTIETFLRVASFASAVIPANLGALEAASLAAASAAGVDGGGPLAIARRVRGLFWAAVGFVIYPRRSDRRSAPTATQLLDIA